jgi:hypothetical protein
MTIHGALLAESNLQQNNHFNLLEQANRDRCCASKKSAVLFGTHGEASQMPELAYCDLACQAGLSCQPEIQVCMLADLRLRQTLYIFPHSTVLPPNYRKVLKSGNKGVDSHRYAKFNFLNSMTVAAVGDFVQRDRFCSLIAINEVPTPFEQRELYSERVNLIRWLEKQAPEDFDLCGAGWHRSPARLRFCTRVKRRLRRHLHNI